MRSLLIIGAGGFGRECHDVAIAMNQVKPQFRFLGFLDDVEPNQSVLQRRRAQWLGPTKRFRQFAGADYIVGIADPRLRQHFSELADAAGLNPATLIHPSVTCGADVVVGAGSVICSHTTITTNIRIGRHVQVNPNCTLGHDATLMDYVTILPSCTIGGNVLLEGGVTMGARSAVIQKIRLGSQSMVGAGAVVLRDVPAHCTVVGVPARVLES